MTFTRSDSDLFLKINSSSETVKVEGQFSGNGVEEVKFADNTVWNRTQFSMPPGSAARARARP